MQTLVLPRLVAGRTLADNLITQLGDSDVVIECANLDSGTSSFADQLVLQLAVQRGVHLRVRQAPRAFGDFFRQCAHARNVSDLVVVD